MKIYTTHVKEDGTYNFEFVKPNRQYDISMTNDDKYCYKEATKRVKLGDKRSVKNTDFFMTGMKLYYESDSRFQGVAQKGQ